MGSAFFTTLNVHLSTPFVMYLDRYLMALDLLHPLHGQPVFGRKFASGQGAGSNVPIARSDHALVLDRVSPVIGELRF